MLREAGKEVTWEGVKGPHFYFNVFVGSTPLLYIFYKLGSGAMLSNNYFLIEKYKQRQSLTFF